MEVILSGAVLYLTCGLIVAMIATIIALTINVLNKPNSEVQPTNKPAFVKEPTLNELRQSKKRQRAKTSQKKPEAILRVEQRESKSNRSPKKIEAPVISVKTAEPQFPAPDAEDYAADEEGMSPAESEQKKHVKKIRKSHPKPVAKKPAAQEPPTPAKDEGWKPLHPQVTETKTDRLQKRVDKLERERATSRQDNEILRGKLSEERANVAKLNAEIATLRTKLTASAPSAATPAASTSGKGDGDKLSAMNYTNQVSVKLNKEIEALGKAVTAEKEKSASLKAELATTRKALEELKKKEQAEEKKGGKKKGAKTEKKEADDSAKITQLEKSVSEKDAKMSELEKTIAEKDNKIAELEKTNGEKDAKVTKLEGAVAEKDSKISEFEGKLKQAEEQGDKSSSEKDTKISELEEKLRKSMSTNEELSKRGGEVEQLRSELKKCVDQIEELSTVLVTVKKEHEDEIAHIEEEKAQMVNDIKTLIMEKEDADKKIQTLEQSLSEKNSESANKPSDESSQ